MSNPGYPGDKSSTTVGLGTDPLRRLASFKAPRDLSLGGIKPNKKLFTPNLIVTRNKNKGQHSANTHHKREDRNKKDPKNNKNNKNGPKVIKSSGVFSEGLGGVERHFNRITFNREESNASPERPSLRIRSRIKVDQEDRRIRKVVSDGHDGEEREADFKGRLELDAPVSLPMGDTGLWKRVAKMPVKVKHEYDTKPELGDDILRDVNEKYFVDVKEEEFADIDVVDMLKNDEPTLILIQLPGSLPGRGGREDDEPPRRRHQQQQHQQQPTAADGKSPEETPADEKCYLGDLEEGRIGMLRVHRSGRVTFALGDSVFDALSGVSSSFHQEVVSVAADEPSRSASIVSLGVLRRKLVIFPDWQRLLRDVTF